MGEGEWGLDDSPVAGLATSTYPGRPDGRCRFAALHLLKALSLSKGNMEMVRGRIGRESCMASSARFLN